MHEPGTTLSLPSASQFIAGAKPETQSTDWLNEDFEFPESGFAYEKEILRLINLAIEQTNGNVSEAARRLGVPRDYLRYRLNQNKK